MTGLRTPQSPAPAGDFDPEQDLPPGGASFELSGHHFEFEAVNNVWVLDHGMAVSRPFSPEGRQVAAWWLHSAEPDGSSR